MCISQDAYIYYKIKINYNLIIFLIMGEEEYWDINIGWFIEYFFESIYCSFEIWNCLQKFMN